MIPTPLYSDLHCHPSHKPFHRFPKMSIWEPLSISETQLQQQKKLISSLPLGFTNTHFHNAYSHLSQYINNRINLLFISLSPPEIPHFCISDDSPSRDSLSKTIALKAMSTQIDRTLIEKWHTIYQSRNIYPYYPELEKEYSYILSEVIHESGKHKAVVGVDYHQIEKELSHNQLVLVFTIEGGHSLGIFDPELFQEEACLALENPESPLFSKHFDIIQSNIQHIKTWGNGAYAPLFISIAHHYWNGLCGHAKSFEDIHSHLGCDQSIGIDKGITKLGHSAIQQLLSRQNGRRILIDIKHMSANSRKEFYQLWENYRDKGDSFPIVCSSTAVNGIPKLSNSLQSTDASASIHSYFNPISMNMYDEDIRYIFESNGIIGLTLDDVQMPGSISKNLLHRHREKRNISLIRAEYLRLLMANIFHIVRTIDHPNAWDMICIGSNMDGIDHQFQVFPDIGFLPEMANDMLEFFTQLTENPHIHPRLPREEMHRLMYWFTPEELVHKLMYENALHFLKKYYRDQYLGIGHVAASQAYAI